METETVQATDKPIRIRKDGQPWGKSGPKPDRFTVRDRKMLDGIFEGKSNTQAARDAGFSPNGTTVIASRKYHSETFRNKLIERLREIGLDDEGLAGKLREGMESLAYGMTKDGMVVTLGPDNHARAKYVDMALKASGGYPDPRAAVDMQGARVVVLQNSDAQLGAVGLFGAEVLEGAEPLALPEGQQEGAPEGP